MKRIFIIFLVISTFLTGCSLENEIRIYPGDVEIESINMNTVPDGFIHMPHFSEEDITKIAKATVEQNATIYERASGIYFYVRKDNKLYKFEIFNKANLIDFDHYRNIFLYDNTWIKKDEHERLE